MSFENDLGEKCECDVMCGFGSVSVTYNNTNDNIVVTHEKGDDVWTKFIDIHEFWKAHYSTYMGLEQAGSVYVVNGDSISLTIRKN